MKDLKETKGRILLHIRSARNWLDQAEKAFDDESPARGELNLILARAEVQHAQEKKIYSREFWIKLLIKLQRHKQELMGMTLGIIALGAYLYLPLMLNLAVSDANVPAARSSQMKVQLDAPQAMYGKLTATAERVAETVVEQSALAERNERNLSADGTASRMVKDQEAATVVVSTAEQIQSTHAQSIPAISEKELRGLMKTAEQALKK